ncbi:MAG: alpha/beta hydrolase [Acidobacteriaceae bacterium]
MVCIVAFIVLSAGAPPAQSQPTKQSPVKAGDTSPHTVQFITVDKGVNLEVLDWGGTGRPLVFLAGLGNTAHIFDNFAPKFTPSYHVYGITRRGFGASSAPPPADGNYSADRLGDDVLAVIEALKLDRPVLVGHSIAGEELSSIGSRYPDKVAGLIYLDAGYPYAYYDHKRANPSQLYLILDAIYLKRKLDSYLSGGVQDPQQLMKKLQASLPQFESDLGEEEKRLASMPPQPQQSGPAFEISWAIIRGEQKYTEVHVPILAIFADPHDFGQEFKSDPAARAAAIANDLASTTTQAKAFQAGNPSAHVVLIPNANHYVFKSNEAEVLRDMNAFLAKLP